MPACRHALARHRALPLTGLLVAGLLAVQLLTPARAATGPSDGSPASTTADVTLAAASDVPADTPLVVTVTVHATGALPVSLVALRVDGVRVAVAPVAAGLLDVTVPVTVPTLEAGAHALVAVLRSGGQRLGQSAPVAVTADGQTPPSPPTPPSGSNCAPKPSACGFPDATNTGVTPGTQLKTYDGDVTIDQDGAVFQNAVVNGSIDIEADDVTVRNVRITDTGEGWGIGLIHTDNATISDCEIAPDGPRLLVGIKDVYGDASDTTVEGCDIARTTSGIQTHEGLIADNYIHDMAFKPGDHLNGTTSNGSTVPMTIRHNTILNQYDQTDAISLFQDFGLEANRVVTDNLLAGGSYTIYGGGGGYGPSHDIVITDNRISRIFFPDGGTFGPVAHFENGNRGNVWSDNVWDDTGDPISGDD